MKRISCIILAFYILFLFGCINILYVKGVTKNEIFSDTQKLQENIRNLKYNLQNICPPNSYFKNGSCYCKEGLTWSKKQKKCVSYTESCQEQYGPHTYEDNNYCHCIKGYVWNKTKTRCISHTEDCRSIYGDHVVGTEGNAKYQSLCHCEKGYVWNDARTKCIDISKWCKNKFGSHSYGDKDLKCHCQNGYALDNNGACVTYTEACQEIYGVHSIGSKGTRPNSASCNCERGYIWNLDKTKCITKWQGFTQYFTRKYRRNITKQLLTSIFVAFIPILIWFIVLLVEFRRIFETHISTKWTFIFFVSGMAVTPGVWIIENSFLQGTNLSPESTSLVYILPIYLIMAIIEELSKFGAALVVLKHNKYFDEAIDAMVYLIVLALGFAFVENFLVAYQQLGIGSMISAIKVTGLRFIGANLLHVICSGTIGFFWALYLLKKRKKFLFWGISLGILLHWVFNAAIMSEGGKALVPVAMIIFGSFALFLLVLNKYDLFRGINRYK